MSVSKLILDPLFETVKYGSSDELPTRQAMLDAGTYVDAQDAAGNRLLHYAVLRGESRFAIDLLAIGANVKAKDADGRTALHHAVMGLARDDHEDSRTICRQLLRAGAEMYAPDRSGRHAHQRLLAEVGHLPNAVEIGRRFPSY